MKADSDNEEDLVTRVYGKKTKVEKTSIDPWIEFLHKRARNKAWYLDSLANHHEDSKIHHKKEVMLKDIKQRSFSHERGELFTLFGGSVLEKVDPAHRQIEFDSSDIEIKRNTAGLPMNEAFFQWAHSKAKEDAIPFFLWLEDHEISTSSPVTARYRKVNVVDYDLKQSLKAHIRGSKDDHKLFAVTGEDHTKESLLTTENMPNLVQKMGSLYGSAAFIWAREDENCFITHPHLAGQYHHSSLTGGKKVRCAGMWTVKNGVVTSISNSSGHYRPSSVAFYKLIRFLVDKHLLSDKVRIRDMLQPEELMDPAQPLGGVKSPYVSLQEYAAWAESRAEVKIYLLDNHVHALTAAGREKSYQHEQKHQQESKHVHGHKQSSEKKHESSQSSSSSFKR